MYNANVPSKLRRREGEAHIAHDEVLSLLIDRSLVLEFILARNKRTIVNVLSVDVIEPVEFLLFLLLPRKTRVQTSRKNSITYYVEEILNECITFDGFVRKGDWIIVQRQYLSTMRSPRKY